MTSSSRYFKQIMLLSMTGYGRASGHFNGKTISVEIRTLNSRLTDLKMRLPGDYKEKEIEVRKLVTQHAERGKIDLLMDVQSDDGGALVTLNKGLFRGYHRELTRLAKELDIPQHDILQTIMRIPNVASTPSGEVDEEEWAAVCRIITEALDQLRAFRDQEGDALEADLQLRVSNIMGLLQKVEPHEKERFTRMRERLNNNMEEVFGKEKLDSNRFEQEILYYLEKMDITEEKVRLEQHCKYFIEQVNNKEISGGRTLNFISQEMGREINTLGAKAYDANIQRLVVQMKDELEKIKEQLANVL